MGHHQAICRAGRAFAFAATLAGAAMLGGCGAVQFEGKVFDYMGLSGEHQEADVKMSERPPLLLPPNMSNLPPPGTGTNAVAGRADWPENPEQVRRQVAKQEADVKAKREAEIDPINPYAGKETLLDKLFARSKSEEPPVADVPEPDPGDQRPEDSTVASSGSSAPQSLTPHVPQEPLPQREAPGPASPDTYNDPSARRALY